MSYQMAQGAKGNTVDDNVLIPSRERWANKFRHRGFWTWEVKALPEEVRVVEGARIVVLRSEFTGKRIYLNKTAQPVPEAGGR